ncbi:hypothetical protein ACFSC4_12765 [Deinococcus malanensis]
MLAPGDGTDHVQVIDARDQARFTVKVVEEHISGVFNLAGPRLSWSEFLTVLGAAQPRWLPHETLQAHGLGHRELPLYLPEHSEQGGLMDVSPQRALSAGLVHTSPSVTAADTRAWSQNAGLSYALTPEREQEILSAVP